MITGRDLSDDGVALDALRHTTPGKRPRAVVTYAQRRAIRAAQRPLVLAEYLSGERVDDIARDIGASERTVRTMLRGARRAE